MGFKSTDRNHRLVVTAGIALDCITPKGGRDAGVAVSILRNSHETSFVAMRTNLLPSGSQLILAKAMCRPLSNEIWRITKSKVFKLNSPYFQIPEGVVVSLPSLIVALIQLDISL